MTAKEIALANGTTDEDAATPPPSIPEDNRPAYEPDANPGRAGRPLWDPPSA